MSLIVTGTIGIDTIYTPEGGHREGVLGGSCAYFAAAASHYGPVRMVAAVGDDFPKELGDTLARFSNIDASGLERRAGSKTFRWGGKYMEDINLRETLFTELGVLEEAPPAVPESFKDSRYLFLANSHPGVQLGMLESLPGLELAVADTMNLWIDIAKEDLLRLLERVDGLVLNNEEAEQLTGKRNPVTAARHILDLGPRFVVVKKGEHGALLIHEEGIGALPAYPAEEVIDPTGAGDTFAGGLMAHVASTGDTSFDGLRSAMAHGTVIASFTIETFSLDRLAELNRDRIQKRYKEFAKMTRIA